MRTSVSEGGCRKIHPLFAVLLLHPNFKIYAKRLIYGKNRRNQALFLCL
ncbi:hypothetical protein HMPREF1548_00678 [Clostridium sp. KLE 1755]|nr:hypothetical protein HMPREF1548_00678 [Clostridium sp. KLE 1755]